MIFNPAEIRALVRIATKRTGAPVHDEDLEQEAALNAIEAFHRLDHVAHPRALLMKIVFDTVRDHWRRRRPLEDDLDSIDARFISSLPSIEADLDLRRRVELVQRALALLPPSKRALLDLFYIQDRSVSEIAARLGKSSSAVKMELLRARHSLARIVRSIATKKSR